MSEHNKKVFEWIIWCWLLSFWMAIIKNEYSFFIIWIFVILCAFLFLLYNSRQVDKKIGIGELLLIFLILFLIIISPLISIENTVDIWIYYSLLPISLIVMMYNTQSFMGKMKDWFFKNLLNTIICFFIIGVLAAAYSLYSDYIIKNYKPIISYQKHEEINKDNIYSKDEEYKKYFPDDNKPVDEEKINELNKKYFN